MRIARNRHGRPGPCRAGHRGGRGAGRGRTGRRRAHRGARGMIVRLRRNARIEGVLGRFDAWWQGLSTRERVLVGTLAALLAGVVLVYGVVKPVQAARAQARADIRQAETLLARVRAAGRLESAPRTLAAGPPQAIVTSTAATAGLQPTVAEANGAITATLTDAPYPAVVTWLGSVASTSTIGVRRVTMQRGSASGRVNATVEFQP
ncbi:MAG: type II secretion system protein M [Sphingomonas hengshuiensis]|uniref:Type II secretion system protein M n=1 Tax=Sphingomonas hengshuiensis TaxID=1609977 RepID=A0A2W4Z243_9SPHN|nr:MAG: type II secretion system protein M [Sphingomonas hengshuiensis]